MPSVEDSLLKAIAKLLKSTIQQSIYEVYELPNQWCASKPKQRPDMAHVVSVLSLLIGQWKPTTKHWNPRFERRHISSRNTSISCACYEGKYWYFLMWYTLKKLFILNLLNLSYFNLYLIFVLTLYLTWFWIRKKSFLPVSIDVLIINVLNLLV